MEFRILHVEDTPNDQRILKRSLEKRMPIGLDLVTAETATEGLKKIEEERFDLVLLDHKLPGMTGLEFLEELQKIHFKVPVIFVTGKGSEKIAVKAMKLGARDYIVKDEIDSNRLVEAIGEIIMQSSLPEEVDIETAKHVAALFSKSPIIQMEILKTAESKPESEIPPAQLIKTLKKLAQTGVLEAKPLRSVVACPSCGSLTATLYLQCPECRSIQLDKGEALEHLSCGHIDFRSRFDKGETGLICPKCGKKLKMLGVDYRRVETWYRCSNSHVFGGPTLGFRCSECDENFTLDAAIIETLHQYQLTEHGRQLLRLGLLKTRLIEKDDT